MTDSRDPTDKIWDILPQDDPPIQNLQNDDGTPYVKPEFSQCQEWVTEILEPVPDRPHGRPALQ